MRNNFWYTYHKIKLEESNADHQENLQLSGSMCYGLPSWLIVVLGLCSYAAPYMHPGLMF